MTAKDIEIVRCEACRGYIFQSDRPVAYADHGGEKPMNKVFITDRTMRVITNLVVERLKEAKDA